MIQARGLPWTEAAVALVHRLAATHGEAIGEARRWSVNAIATAGLDSPVGTRSTITAVAIGNGIEVRTAWLLAEQGAPPPVLTRASVVGAERSRESFDDAYREHVRRIARATTGEG
jgi:hypothetical protein